MNKMFEFWKPPQESNLDYWISEDLWQWLIAINVVIWTVYNCELPQSENVINQACALINK